MLSSKVYLRLASGLTLFTCLGHTLGHFKKVDPAQEMLVSALDVMSKVQVSLPMQTTKTLMQIQDGSSLSLSVFLLMTGLILFFLSGCADRAPFNKIQITIGAGLAVIGILSQIYFFPLPAICTLLAGVFTITATRAKT